MGIDPEILTRSELQKAVARYVDSSHHRISFKGLFDGLAKWISKHPVLTFREAGKAWKELKTEVAEMGGLSLRRLIIQEYAYSIGSTGYNSRLSSDARGLALRCGARNNVPLRTAYALTRRTKRRLRQKEDTGDPIETGQRLILARRRRYQNMTGVSTKV